MTHSSEADPMASDSTILVHRLDVRMAWSPDSRMLATASWDRVARLWDTHGEQVAELTGHAEDVWALAWLPDGTGLVSGGADGVIRVWDAATRECRAVAHVLAPVSALQFDGDGRMVRAADRGEATAGQPVPYVFELCNAEAGREAPG
jgi:WD40 repeat protein